MHLAELVKTISISRTRNVHGPQKHQRVTLAILSALKRNCLQSLIPHDLPQVTHRRIFQMFYFLGGESISPSTALHQPPQPWLIQMGIWEKKKLKSSKKKQDTDKVIFTFEMNYINIRSHEWMEQCHTFLAAAYEP